MLETQYNIVVKTSKEEISARLAGEFIAEKLEIKSNDPILIRKRFVYDVNGVPMNTTSDITGQTALLIQ